MPERSRESWPGHRLVHGEHLLDGRQLDPQQLFESSGTDTTHQTLVTASSKYPLTLAKFGNILQLL